MWGKCKQQKTITEDEKKEKLLQHSPKTGWNIQNYWNSQGKSRLFSPLVSCMKLLIFIFRESKRSVLFFPMQVIVIYINLNIITAQKLQQAVSLKQDKLIVKLCICFNDPVILTL